MGRYSSAFRSSTAGSTTLPLGSLYASASVRLILREVHVFNTTTTATDMALRQFTATGTQGAGSVEIPHNPAQAAATGTTFLSHTVTPTITAGEFARASLAAAIGGGVVWVFNDGLIIPAGTGNGIGVIVGTGTGQICDLTFIWDE